jgi:2-succinyl-5-enolpyruvyl-6-hydroxy-3-cyclohexene-1-carboxylate synthase
MGLRIVVEVTPASEFAGTLLLALVRQGVQHVVLSPGARSQALALAAAELEALGLVQLHVRIDERVASFVALGLAVELRVPTVIITTSGTAVANLHPAVLEAHHAGVPLILLTADRPEELREIGSNQTTHQRDIFGPAVRWSLDEPAPTFGSGTVRRAHELAEQAWQVATDAHAPGPVHLNLAFREPLSGGSVIASGASEMPDGLALNSASAPAIAPAPATRPSVVAHLDPAVRTLVIAGADAGPEAEEVAHAAHWPLIAEVSSGARFGRNLVPQYREVLAMPELVADIERIVVWGHPTLSREVPRLIADTGTGIETIVVRGQAPEGYNPGHNVASFVDSVRVAEVPGGEQPGATREWLGRWLRAGAQALAAQAGAEHPAPNVEAARDTSPAAQRAFVAAELEVLRTPVTREMLVDAVWRATWPHDRLVLAASRLIRVADRTVGGKKISVHANRGLAGIDGTIATGVGIALAAAPALTRVLVGDLAALHDSGALLLGEHERRPRVQVIVGNDGGGTIFDGLEVAETAESAAMDRVFLTPQRVDFAALAQAYGWHYSRVNTAGELERALTEPSADLQLIEVVLAR